MTADHLDYFQQRAEAELQLAQAAEHANAVRAHYVMAGHYLDLVHNDEAQAESAAGGENGRSVPAGLNEWAIRHASRTSQEHGDLAPDYVTARIEACRTAGDWAGVRLWEQVLILVERDPIGKVLARG